MNSDKKEGKGIKATVILEIIGTPPEHLLKTLEDLIKRMDEEKGVHVTGKRINEPVPMKENDKFYTTFAEVDLEVEDILYLSIIMFRYMPAHIEVLEPELIALTNNGWSDILSELTRRLHGYEEIARILQLENAKMQKKIRELLPASEQTEIKKEKKKEIKEENKK